MKKSTSKNPPVGPGRNGGQIVALTLWHAAKQEIADYKEECKHDYRLGKSHKLIAKTRSRRAMVKLSRRNNRKAA